MFVYNEYDIENKNIREWVYKMSLQYPQEYADFARLVKSLVILNIMIRTIDFDVEVIQHSNAKLSRAYGDILDYVRKQLEKEMRQVKRSIRETGGTIVNEIQLHYAREVHAKFRGFHYKERYLNDILRAECEEKLREIVLLKNEQSQPYPEIRA